MKRWEKAKTREVPLMEKLGAWFVEHLPPAQPPAIMHNDFYLHNVMIDSHDPAKIVGVFDWEMSTLGDPLVDVGIALNYWRDNTDPPELLETSQGEAHTLRKGFMTRDELIERYGKRTGRDREPRRLLLGVGALEERHRGRADLRPLRPRPDHRPPLRRDGDARPSPRDRVGQGRLANGIQGVGTPANSLRAPRTENSLAMATLRRNLSLGKSPHEVSLLDVLRQGCRAGMTSRCR